MTDEKIETTYTPTSPRSYAFQLMRFSSASKKLNVSKPLLEDNVEPVFVYTGYLKASEVPVVLSTLSGSSPSGYRAAYDHSRL